MSEPFEVEITQWVEPGPDQLGEWAARAPATLEIIEAVMSGDGSVDVLFWHERKRYRGRAIITGTGGAYATMKAGGPAIEEEG